MSSDETSTLLETPPPETSQLDSACEAPATREEVSVEHEAVERGHHESPLLLAGVVAVFFGSGAASLICEVVWFKQLQVVLGSSMSAISVVVASFFSGLALGSWLCGRAADRWKNLLRSYAGLELSLAVVSLLVTLLLASSESWIGWIAPWLGANAAIRTPLMVLTCLVILLPPTVLMGATLPVLAKYFVRRKTDMARRVGLLYGVNTLGAAAGCYVVGFILIGHFGVIQSALIGSSIYVLIGLAAATAAFFAQNTNTENTTLRISPNPGSDAGQSPRQEVAAESSVGTSGLMLVFASMGFAAIAYEVLWFRLLTNFSVQSVYAFSGMLATYLLGLVLGSFICARFLAAHKERHLVYFSRVQLLIALTAAVSLVMLGKSTGILRALENAQRVLGLDATLSWACSGVASFLLLSLLVLLLPATMIGIGFPLASELTVGRLGRLGSRLGLLYGMNTLGGVLGSLVTGFVLLPMLGSQASFLVVLLLTLSLFAVTVATQSSLRRDSRLWREGIATAAFLLAVFSYIGHDYLQTAQSKFIGAEVLDFHEGKDATYVVLGYESETAGPFQQIIVNGKSFANNSPPGRRYMSALAHLPTLLHPHPKSAVVIAIGTGTTVGSLTLHPTLDDIWAVDISPSVFAFAPHFVPLNQDFMNSPKVKPVVEDGRQFLLCTDQRFDVLTFEPPPPHDAGIVNLYSQDFYRLARQRMTENGIVCQWMPLDMPRDKVCQMLIQSMQKEFPHVSLWISNRCEGIAIGSTKPLSIDFAKLAERMNHPALKDNLTSYGLGEPEQLLATFVAADEDLARFVGDVPPVTDNRPYVEYFNMFPLKQLKFDDILRYRTPINKWLTQPPPDALRMKTADEVIHDIWYAFELKTDGKLQAARRRLLNARQLDPANEYVRFLLDDVELSIANESSPPDA